MESIACAHSKVVLIHRDYPDGTESDSWECDSGCGKQFLPECTDMNIRNLRDWFAGMALQGMVAGSQSLTISVDEFAEQSFKLANAMLVERRINISP